MKWRRATCCSAAFDVNMTGNLLTIIAAGEVIDVARHRLDRLFAVQTRLQGLHLPAETVAFFRRQQLVDLHEEIILLLAMMMHSLVVQNFELG